MRRHLAAFAAVVLCSTPCAAQLGELRPGVRVRITAPGVVASRLTGTVLSRTPDTLVLASPELAALSVPVARLKAIEISRGKSRAEGAKTGLKWGVPIGLGFGALVAGAANECRGCEFSAADIVTLYTLSGAFYGAGIGALIGKEKWVPFDLAARVSMRPVATPRGLALGITF